MIDKTKALKKESQNHFCIFELYQTNLINAKRFVCYDKEKRPYNAETKKRTDYTDSNNWRSYNFACESVIKTPKFKGVGFVFGYDAENDKNYCGLDIDYCIDDSGTIAPEAIELIEMLDTYTEISMSGRGIHCIFIANKIENVCKNNSLKWCKSLEMYDKKRYFALTGNVIRNKDAEYRQEQCDEIYRKYFAKPVTENKCTMIKTYSELPKASILEYENYFKNVALKKDATLLNYWNGKRPFSDESSNDAGFCKKLGHWLKKDAALVKHFLLKSPYFEQKDKAHKNKWIVRKDYAERTIAFAFRGL